MKYIDSERLVIKSWCDNPEESAIEQARNLANLPFAFHHIALMPDTHSGKGVPVGGVFATKNAIVPNAVGADIGCGVSAVKTSLIHIDKLTLKKIMSDVRKMIPVGMKPHDKEPPEADDLIVYPGRVYKVMGKEESKIGLSLGTLGSGNHFWEIERDQDGYIWFMIHSGSRHLGHEVNKFYNKEAIKLNERWFSRVQTNHELAFIPIEDELFKSYLAEMNFALDFAKLNRYVMAKRTKEAFLNHTNCVFSDIDVHHNYVQFENHFGENVIVHRKGATSAREDEIGIIPGSQGTSSYIVKGLGNPESFMSCSHGAGRAMSRTAAKNNLDLTTEIKKLDDKGIIHGIRNVKDLDEASSSYKDIETVMKEQANLVEIIHKLEPLAVIKG